MESRHAHQRIANTPLNNFEFSSVSMDNISVWAIFKWQQQQNRFSYCCSARPPRDTPTGCRHSQQAAAALIHDCIVCAWHTIVVVHCSFFQWHSS